MADMLSIGSSALLSYRRALDTVSHNIANVDTEGYSRQRVNLVQRTGTLLQVQNYGEGVQVANVQRMTDEYLFNRIVADDVALSRLDTMATLTARVDGWLSSDSGGLSDALQALFSGFGELAANPSSTAARTSVIDQAGSLSARFADLQQNFDDLDREIDDRTASIAEEINDTAARIAKLNDEISRASLGNDQNLPNDLLDQRDQALRDLGNLVGYTSIESETDGSISVFIGNGQPLVLGNKASTLEVHDDEYGRPRSLQLRNGSQLSASMTDSLAGGELGGLLDTRREVVEPSLNELGQMAAALANAVNSQHRQGVDQYGELGGDFFNFASTTAIASTANAGSAGVDVGIADAGSLSGHDYELSFDGSAWTLTDLSSGAVVPTTGTGAAGDPLLADGMALTLSGTPAAGDQFLVQPARGAAGRIDVAISDPARIAVAAPVQAMASTDNLGSGTVSSPSIIDIDDPALQSAVSIVFVDASNYTINGAGPYAYSAGSTISLNGYQISIDGAPAAGDEFTVTATGADSGDNSNGLLLAAVADLELLDNGRSTLSEANSALVASVGSQALQYQIQAEATASIQAQNIAELDSIAGVNLDEEAADLTRYEQAYNAAAQVVATAKTIFDTLLAAVSR